MSETKQVHAGDLKVGSFVVFNGKACLIRDIQKSRPGKHGHAKCRIQAVSITDSQKIIKIMPGGDKVQVPIIEKRDAQVLSVSGSKANVMDMTSYETFDLNIPDDFKDKVAEGVTVHYWVVLGQKVVKQVK